MARVLLTTTLLFGLCAFAQEAKTKAAPKSCPEDRLADCVTAGLKALCVDQPETCRDTGKYDTWAYDAFTRACRKDVAEGCRGLGWMGLRGRGGKAKVEETVKTYEKGCKLGSLGACHELAGLFEGHVRTAGGQLPPAPEKAAAVYRQACEAGSNASCVSLARMWEEGDAKVTASGGIAQMLGMSCDRGHGFSCTYLGQRHTTGQGVVESMEQAKALFDKGCKLGEKLSCTCVAQPDYCAAQKKDTPESVGNAGVDCARRFAEEQIATRALSPKDLVHVWQYLRTGALPPPKSEAQPGGMDPSRAEEIKKLAKGLQALEVYPSRSGQVEGRPPRIVAGDLLVYALAWKDDNDAVMVATGNVDPIKLTLPLTLFIPNKPKKEEQRLEKPQFHLSVDPLESSTRRIRPALHWLRIKDPSICGAATSNASGE